jgi:hypothetical protein
LHKGLRQNRSLTAQFLARVVLELAPRRNPMAITRLRPQNVRLFQCAQVPKLFTLRLFIPEVKNSGIEIQAPGAGTSPRSATYDESTCALSRHLRRARERRKRKTVPAGFHLGDRGDRGSELFGRIYVQREGLSGLPVFSGHAGRPEHTSTFGFPRGRNLPEPSCSPLCG